MMAKQEADCEISTEPSTSGEQSNEINSGDRICSKSEFDALTDILQSIVDIKTSNDEIKTEIQTRLNSLEENAIDKIRLLKELFQQQVSKCEQALVEHNRRLEDIELASKTHNLVLKKFQRSPARDTDLKQKVAQFLSEKLQVDVDFEIEVINVGFSNYAYDVRPILLKFSNLSDRDKVYATKYKLKGSRYSIEPDFPASVRLSRRELLKFAKLYAIEHPGSKYKLIGDTLFMNNEKYIYDYMAKEVISYGLASPNFSVGGRNDFTPATRTEYAARGQFQPLTRRQLNSNARSWTPDDEREVIAF